MTGEYGQEQRQVNFFTVGGPTVNDMTRDLVAVWDDSKTSVEQAYHFEKGNTLDGKLVIHYPAHYVEDFGQSNGEVPGPKVYKPKTDETGRILNDFGFIIIGLNPYDHTQDGVRSIRGVASGDSSGGSCSRAPGRSQPPFPRFAT